MILNAIMPPMSCHRCELCVCRVATLSLGQTFTSSTHSVGVTFTSLNAGEDSAVVTIASFPLVVDVISPCACARLQAPVLCCGPRCAMGHAVLWATLCCGPRCAMGSFDNLNLPSTPLSPPVLTGRPVPSRRPQRRCVATTTTELYVFFCPFPWRRFAVEVLGQWFQPRHCLAQSHIR
jgi:hypothetical protein